MNRATIPFALLFLASCGPQGEPKIVVSDAWARATADGQGSGAVYAVIRNDGPAADKLTAASTDAAAMAMIHENRNEFGVVRMRMVPELELPVGQTVELRPGGTHIMLEGLRAPLVAGEKFELALQFGESGRQVVKVKVVAAGER